MKFRLFAVAAATILAVNAVPASAQLSFSVAGGLSAPVSDLGDLADIGYNVAAGLNVGAPLLPVGFRFEGAYNGFQIKNSGGDVRIISGTANAIYNLGRTNDAPYLIAGVGGYNRQLTINRLGTSDGKTVLGLNGGGGLRFPLGGISTFFEARYHVMLGDSMEATNYQFIPITFGIVF
jgi:hypothetical protein